MTLTAVSNRTNSANALENVAALSNRTDPDYKLIKFSYTPEELGIRRRNKPRTLILTDEQIEKKVYARFGLDINKDGERIKNILGEGNPFDLLKTTGINEATYNKETGRYEISVDVDKKLIRQLQGKAIEVKKELKKPNNESTPSTTSEKTSSQDGIDRGKNRQAEIEKKLEDLPSIPLLPPNKKDTLPYKIGKAVEVAKAVMAEIAKNPPTAEEALDGVQAILDTAGIFDPTPITDGTSAVISAARGEYGYAAISVIGAVIPYFGDIAKVGKIPRFLKVGERSLKYVLPIMKNSDEAIDFLTRIRKGFDDVPTSKLPKDAQDAIKNFGKQLDEAIETEKKLKNASNRKDLLSGEWIGKDIKPGDKLPEGYHWRDNQIVRNPDKAKGNYAKLQVDESGKISLSKVERLSNPTVMNKNFEIKTKANIRQANPKLTEAQVDNLYKAERARVQVHHILPDEIIRNTELGKAAQKIGYNLDNGNNLKGLPRSVDKAKQGEIGHWSSHPNYSKEVRNEMKEAAEKLKFDYKTDTLDKVPDEAIKKEMKRIETMFRKKIETGNVPQKDGRLSLLEMPLMRKNYEIRV